MLWRFSDQAAQRLKLRLRCCAPGLCRATGNLKTVQCLTWSSAADHRPKEARMTVEVIIRRKFEAGLSRELLPLISQLRSLAIIQPGYISGRTLSRVDRAGEYMVISTWQSLEAWNRWVGSAKRCRIQAKIDGLLGETTQYEIYEPL